MPFTSPSNPAESKTHVTTLACSIEKAANGSSKEKDASSTAKDQTSQFEDDAQMLSVFAAEITDFELQFITPSNQDPELEAAWKKLRENYKKLENLVEIHKSEQSLALALTHR